MLAEHLSQEHDWASRRATTIDEQVARINQLLGQHPANILDLACGPGLYTQALAAWGHSLVGVDFSPAAIEYAREKALAAKLDIQYIQQDILEFKPQCAFDCILFIFGEFNTFSRPQAKRLLRQCASWLKSGGFLLLEAQTWQGIEQSGLQPDLWSVFERGLFADQPYICLQENVWQKPLAHNIFYIIDALSAGVQQYAATSLAYSNGEYELMLQQAGFTNVSILDEDQWPHGRDFSNKLLTFYCQARCDGHSAASAPKC